MFKDTPGCTTNKAGFQCEYGLVRGSDFAGNLVQIDGIKNPLQIYDQTEQGKLYHCAQHLEDMMGGPNSVMPNYYAVYNEKDKLCYVKDQKSDIAGKCAYPSEDFAYIYKPSNDQNNPSDPALLQNCILAQNFRYSRLKNPNDGQGGWGGPPKNLGSLGTTSDGDTVKSKKVTIAGDATDLDIAIAGMECMHFCNNPDTWSDQHFKVPRNAAILLGTDTGGPVTCGDNPESEERSYCNAMKLGPDHDNNNCACFFRKANPGTPHGDQPHQGEDHCYEQWGINDSKSSLLISMDNSDLFPKSSLPTLPPPSMDANSQSAKEVQALLMPMRCSNDKTQNDIPDGNLCLGSVAYRPFGNSDQFLFQTTGSQAGTYVGSICDIGLSAPNSICHEDGADYLLYYTSNGLQPICELSYNSGIDPSSIPSEIINNMSCGTILCAKAVPQ